MFLRKCSDNCDIDNIRTFSVLSIKILINFEEPQDNDLICNPTSQIFFREGTGDEQQGTWIKQIMF